MVTKLCLLAALPSLLAAQATVTLSTSSNPSRFGAPLTLTATVTIANLIAPTSGRVTFYDGVTPLGSQPLTGGAARFSTLLLPAGTRKLHAFYSGDPNYVSATSNVVTQRVNALAGGDFVPQANLNLPANTAPGAVADFNGDGIADYAYLTPTNDVGVSLGKGDGTFQPPVTSPGGGPRLTVADFNLDGIPDLFTNGNPLSAPASLLLGNGDGTFRQAATYPILNYPVTVADFNVDGIPDLFVGNLLMLGRGDGTFDTKTFSPSAPAVVGVMDFNNDGKPDLVLFTIDSVMVGGIFGGTNYTSSIKLYPGNGDGTFQAPVVLATETYNISAGFGYRGSEIGGFVLGDCNGDGQPDVVYWDDSGPVLGAPYLKIAPAVKVRLNSGDGTFAPAQTTYTSVSDLIPADFNGDGTTDLLVLSGNSFFILTGNGDGTFQPSGSIYSGNGPAIVVADFNGDGRADLFVNNSGTVSLLLGAASGTGLRLIASGGTPQSTPIGNAFAAPLEVTLVNNSVPVAGVTVTFSASGQYLASAILPSSSAVTDASGKAHITAWANEYGGPYNVTGTALGVTANFSLTNTVTGAGLPIAPLMAFAGTPQSTTAGTAFPIPLTVKVTDANPTSPQPLSGVIVRFTAPTGGPTAFLSSPIAVTDASGIAAVNATASTSLGTYNVTAFVGSSGSLTAQFSLTNTGPVSTNLALGKTATQSSTLAGYPSATAGSAVDGNTNGNFLAGSVTATNPELNAWWHVDLGASAAVTSIIIFNRTDCCASRLTDYWVFLSDTPFLASDTPATLQNRAGTLALHQTLAPSPSTALSLNATGRYLRVQLSGTGYLSLAEVQVFGTGGAAPLTNLALFGAATQSSIFPGYPSAAAQSAIDGNTDGNFFNGSVTATNFDGNAWWQVDLGSPVYIDSVVIWNRTDCCADRLSAYYIAISTSPFLPTDTWFTLQNRPDTFLFQQSSAPHPSTTIQGLGQLGRYVRILTGGILSLAEVQVFGAPAANLALGKPATQSTTFPGSASAAATAAVDGNTDGHFFNGSVTATNQESNPWWQVDLGASVPVGSVVLWNRSDCCGSRLGDYYLFLSDTPFDAADTPTTILTRVGVTNSHWTTAPDPARTEYFIGLHARYIRIQLAGPGILSLAEIQVFGPSAVATANAAQGKTAAQSSTLAGYLGAGPASAVDGNSDGNFFNGSVTATNPDPSPWWQVDLGASQSISTVAIENRTDCCASRLSDYWVFISDTPFLATDTPTTLQNRAATFASHQTNAPAPSDTILAGVRGRYVRVQLSHSDYLSLAEVRVFAQ